MKKIYILILLSIIFIFSGCILKEDSVQDNLIDQSQFEYDGYLFTTGNDHLQKYNKANDTTQDIFINAVNLGVALPGKQPGETNIPKDYYDRWFKILGDNGINVIRIYTLHRPHFYQSLQEYNLKNPENPMYVLHGIWLNYKGEVSLEEHNKQFELEIQENVQAIHGDIEIDQRYGKAWGKYEYNISPWVMGWIIGREVEPAELEATDGAMNAEEDVELESYEGIYFSIADVPKSTAWIVEKIDYLAEYEKDNYNNERPISFSSWPTLDPLNHPSEVTEEDVAELQLYKIQKRKSSTGYFASYHAYPYYPEFIDEDEKYDVEGENPYFEYLKELRAKYDNIPLFIAEYGVPSSWGNAKYADSGMNHGGHTEVEQGEYSVDMINGFYDLGLAGGAYFSLFDEWWKNFWITEPLTFPREDYRLWHDMTNGEQNYGLLTFETKNMLPKKELTLLSIKNDSKKYVKKIETFIDHQFFYLNIVLENNYTDKIYIAFNTYNKNIGERKLLNGKEIEMGSEFLLEIKKYIEEEATANFYVTNEYDLKGIWFDNPIIKSEKSYESTSVTNWHPQNSDDGVWNLVTWQNRQAYTDGYGNSLPEQYQKIGKLKIREFSEIETSLDAVVYDTKSLKIRIPWVILQFSDPSKRYILYGYEAENKMSYRETDGINITTVFGEEIIETEKITWDTWKTIPLLLERKKNSFDIFMRNARSLPFILN
ncbi:MAG: hypothetical protein ACQESN_07665 [Thermotogota bacterium]